MTQLVAKELRVGVLGLGLMGSAVAANLLRRGYQVHVYNRTPEKALQLSAGGGIVHSSPKELASSVDVLITFLTDERAVDEVALGSSGFLPDMERGTLWIDMSTEDSDASARFAAEASRLGVKRLDAPVVGGPELTEQGKEVLLVGGSEEQFRMYEGLLNELGSPALYIGKSSMGHRMKLIVNLYLGLVAESFSEAFVLSLKLGFEPDAFVSVLNRTNHKNYFTEFKGPRISKGDFRTTFSMSNLVKDLRLAMKQASGAGAVLPSSSMLLQLYEKAIARDQGKEDFTAIAREIGLLNSLRSEG